MQDPRGRCPIDDFDPTGLARRDAAAAQELVRARADAPAGGRAAACAARRAPRSLRLMKPHTSLRAAGRPRRHRRARCTSATRSSRSRAGVDALGAPRERDERRAGAAPAARDRPTGASSRARAPSARLDELARRSTRCRRVAEHERARRRRLERPGGEARRRRLRRRAVERGLQRGATAATSRASSTTRSCWTRFRDGARRCRPGSATASTSASWSSRGSPPQRLGGRVLDAGSTLNHLHVLRRLRPRTDDLHIVTLAPEEQRVPAARRLLPLRRPARAAAAPTRPTTASLSISTLEHVGTDTTLLRRRHEGRGATHSASCSPPWRELRRVLRPGGDCYITVPVGRGERFDVGALAHAGGARRDRRRRSRPPSPRSTTSATRDGAWRRSRPRGRGGRRLPRPLHERRRRPGRRRGRRGGRLPAPGARGLTVGPRASVVVVTTVNAAGLARCLRSLAALADHPPFETIVVLNGADDHVRDVAARGERRDGRRDGGQPRVRRRREPRARSRVGRVHRAPARRCRGRRTGWLAALVRCADEHPEAGAVGSRVLNPDGTLQLAGAVVWRDGTHELGSRRRRRLPRAPAGRLRGLLVAAGARGQLGRGRAAWTTSSIPPTTSTPTSRWRSGRAAR